MSVLASDICADFLVEAREILDQLGEQMVVLERDPFDREGLNAVFRGFHTIKGGAGFLDLGPMVHICHAAEDRLDAARSGAAPLDAGAFDGAQQAIDLLVDMLQAVAAGAMPADAPADVLACLRAGMPGRNAAQATPSAAAAIAQFAAGGDDIDDLDFEALLDSLHGTGSVPGALAAQAEPATPPAAVAPMPAAHPAPARAATPVEPADQTVRVDVRRLDAMVNLVGELVLARNRL